VSDQTRSKRKAPRSAWKKGQSGNPGGRPKAVIDVRDLAREQTPLAIKALIEVASNPDSSQRVQAAVALLDRGWGKPLQAVEHTGADGGPIEIASMSQKASWRRERSCRRTLSACYFKALE
jgi:Family of unknown function (DUF5681)